MTFQERKALVYSYLGKTVNIVIDRPVGYVHQKENYSLTYPINYGYIPGVIGGDGEELDVYLLGEAEPVNEYKCRIIGIAHRENDVEDKLIGAPVGMELNQAEIAEAVDFQEKYYKTTIESLYQKSCGIILYRQNKSSIQYLLLKQTGAQSWSFPKGHMEKGEDEKATAYREVLEETGIRDFILTGYRTTTSYILSNLIKKTVVLFAAKTDKLPKIMNKNEISEYRFVNAREAKKLLHPDYKEIIDDIEEKLTNECF